MKLAGDWLVRRGTQDLLHVLTGAGYQALFVGGCVRDALSGKPVGDIDIATDALAAIVTHLTQAAGFRVIPTGVEHGTVTVMADGIPHEVTTFRRDVETDGRRAIVAFSTNIAIDAARRDFTMNALYARADGTLIDPLGGLPDLLAKRVRFVGDAGQRIREDYLRILRFFRFHAYYGDPAHGIDADGLAACAANIRGIATLSAERIGAEMRKLLAATDPAPVLAVMMQSGILPQILPGANPIALAPLVHLEAGLTPRWQRRLAVLGGDLSRLRLSRAETVAITTIRDETGTGHSPAALGFLHGASIAVDVLLARAALLTMPLPEDWQAGVARGEIARFPVSAADLAPLSGPALGARLKTLRIRWLASNLQMVRQELISSP